MNISSDIQEYLLKHGIKPSLQRIAILDYLFTNRTHPTAEEVYNALHVSLPTLSLTTVYNTLKLYADRGVLLALLVDEKNIRFDIDVSNHAHFQCIICKNISDLPIEDRSIQEEVAGMRITETHLYYKGYCKTCFSIENKVEEAKNNII